MNMVFNQDENPSMYIDPETKSVMVQEMDVHGNIIYKKKRGRKSKREIELLNSMNKSKENVQNHENEEQFQKQNKNKNQNQTMPKKRGRKPKGGKIIKTNTNIETNEEEDIPNIILQLKCTEQELTQHILKNTGIPCQTHTSNTSPRGIQPKVEPYNINQIHNIHNIQYSIIEEDVEDGNLLINPNQIQSQIQTHSQSQLQPQSQSQHNKSLSGYLHEKIQNLQFNLHHNTIPDKKSDCFWCGCSFTNTPVYIPKSKRNGTYEVYGCFSSPECAVAYLFKENIDTSIKWERYSMLNHLYKKIYNYRKNIKPAPSPFYILNKFYGTMTEEEYHELLTNDNLLLVLDKPLTRIVPELYEEHQDTYLLSNTNMNSSNPSNLSNQSLLCNHPTDESLENHNQHPSQCQQSQQSQQNQQQDNYRLSRKNPTIQEQKINKNKWIFQSS